MTHGIRDAGVSQGELTMGEKVWAELAVRTEIHSQQSSTQRTGYQQGLETWV